ncbi:MAG: DUF5011 domain-containing protein, partial [Planctomycetaceae bacterium]|nr:DUF5011 domain-containing protein [Planctomycetaceae bacterium]
PSWVTTANEPISQNGNQSFSYTAQPNTSTNTRAATLTFTTTSGANIVTKTHRITQSGAAATLSLSSPTRSFGANGGNHNFTVSSNTNWSWSGRPFWVTTANEPTSQSGNQTFSYSALTRPSPRAPPSPLTTPSRSGANTVTKTHRITQGGAATTLSLSSPTGNFEADGGTEDFAVSSSTNWSWIGRPFWVTANEPARQSGNQSFSYTVAPNTTTSARTATLTFGTTSGENPVTRTYRITQGGAAATLALSTSRRDFAAAGGGSGLTVTSNTTWNWSGKPSWVTANEFPRQTGNQTFTYSVEPNTTTSARSATLTFTTTSGDNPVTRTYKIKQNGATAALSLSSSTRSFGANGGAGGFTVSSNTTWRWSGKPSWVTTNVPARPSGSLIFTYFVEPNTKTNARTATLTFTTTSGDIVIKALYTITQEAAEDTLPPVITLVGPPTLTIEASREAEYTDQGATCLDEVDGNLSHAVEVSGHVVNLRNPGTYIIRYDCQDAAGNEAAEVIRTVHVKDTLPPVITLSGNDTLDIEAGFPYEEPGANAEDSLDGNVDVVIDHSGVDTGVLGNHSVTFSATDAAQNTATAGRNVLVRDTLPPVISLHLQDRVIHVGEHGQLGINGVINAPDGLPVEDERNPGDNVTPVPGPRGEGTIRETPFTQPDGTPVISRQKWVIRTGAGEEEPHLPIARVWDHGDTDLEISTTLTLIDLDGNAEETVVNEVDFSRRSTYLFRYDARDSAGNHAEQVAFALIIDDQQAPVISLEGNEQESIEAGSRWDLPGANAGDNIDGDLSENIRYQVDEVSNSENPLRLGEDLTHAQASSLIDTSSPSKYLVTLSVHDQAGIYGQDNSNNQATARRRIEVRDTLPPVITLAGDQTVFVEAGLPYQDAGATSSDRVDGNVEISIDGANIDTNIVGSNTITYTATDAAGNESEVTRTVNVIVTQAPAITNLAGAGVPKTLSALSISFASYLNASYILERSRDLVNWESVREVQGAAQTTTITIDEPILDGGGVYYRVGVKID